MKNIISILFISLAFAACSNDFLEVSPQDKLSDVTFWKTEKDAFDALTAVYGRLGEKGSIWNIWTSYLWGANCMTDDAVGTFGQFQNGSLNSTDGTVKDLWNDFYTSIRSTNVFLANIDKPEMDENKRARFKAEVRFLRAFYYSLLSNNWGSVPLITTPLTLSELQVPRSNKEEIIDFIISELDLSSSALPTSYGADDLGRITKGAALALKARVLLYNDQFTEAAETAEKVMNLGYDLFQDDNGDGYFSLGQQPNEDNQEIIFAIKYQMPDHGYYFQTRIYPPEHVFEGWGSMQVLQSFVNAFECTDGQTIDQSPLFDPDNEFANRDPRLKMAVLRKGDILSDQELLGPVVDDGSRTGYYPRKLLFNQYKGWDRYDTDLVLIRYAEVLLTYAEAKIESNSIDQSVLDAINRIRARAYNAQITELDKYPSITTLNQSHLREIIRRERHVELGLEFNDTRLIDIRRWGIAENVLNGEVFGAKNAEGEYRKIATFTYNPAKHNLWPIPQTEIDLIGADILSQNPGY